MAVKKSASNLKEVLFNTNSLNYKFVCPDCNRTASIPKTVTKMIEKVCLVMDTWLQVLTAIVVVDRRVMNIEMSS